MVVDTYFSCTAIPQLVIDPVENKVISANQEFCRLVGEDVERLLKKSVSILFSPNLPQLIVFTQSVLDADKAWSDELLLQTRRGDLRVEVNARTQVTGDTHYLFLALQSITELEELREASTANQHFHSGIGHWNRVSSVFQEFERENQLLLDAAGEGIYGVDTNGITTFVNPAAEKILGYSASDLAGRNMHSMVHHSHSDGCHFHVEDCPIFAAFKEGRVQRVDDDVFWSKTGQPIDVEYTSTPIKDNGIIVGAVVVFRDVTDKKADQQKLLQALQEVERLKTRLEMENAYLQEEISANFNHREIIGQSKAVQQLISNLQMVAPTDATVLVVGESGTGKELIARAIHDASNRSERSLIRVNCAAIPEELFESEFFGHSKGAFTGAVGDRAGRFELADGGTLFLDEVGEIPLRLQGKLLRVLQEQQFERVGEATTRTVDVRIIAATNKDLKAMVAAGDFREDLYFRLNVFPLQSVPLRERKDDIPVLTQHFLEKSAIGSNKSNLKVSLAELEKLKNYDWPGNVRELENVVERQVILAKGELVTFPDLGQSAPPAESIPQPWPAPTQTDGVITEAQARHVERDNMIKALVASKGVVSGTHGAARILGLRPTTLNSRLKKFGISPRQFRSAAH
jgi:PAS domain S-box-containing protein